MTRMVSSDEDFRNFEIFSFYLFSRDHTNFTVLKKNKSLAVSGTPTPTACPWVSQESLITNGRDLRVLS